MSGLRRERDHRLDSDAGLDAWVAELNREIRARVAADFKAAGEQKKPVPPEVFAPTTGEVLRGFFRRLFRR